MDFKIKLQAPKEVWTTPELHLISINEHTLDPPDPNDSGDGINGPD